MSRGAGGLGVETGKLNANQSTPRVHDIAVAREAICIPLSRRARLMGASAIAGGALRSLAVAAGMVTVFGGAPAFAGCQSSATDLSAGTSCAATASTGTNSTAIGLNANATGTSATAYGDSAIANG
jgi:trimeric autotransporter adhesin